MKESWQNNQKKAEAIAMAVEQTEDQVFITDREGVIEYMNSAFEKTTGYSSKEALGKTPRILRSGVHDQKYYEHLWKHILAGKPFRDIITNKKKNGDLYHIDQTITPITNDEGEIIYFVAVCKDITERIIQQEKTLRLNIQMEREKVKLEQILDFDEQIGVITNVDELVDFIVNKASKILQVERCSLMLLDEDTNELCIKGAKGLDASIIKKEHVYVGFEVAGLVVQEGKAILVKDIETDKRFKRNNKSTYKSKSFLSVPIFLAGKVVGVVNVTDKIMEENAVFTDLDLKILLAIVRQASSAIENTQLYKELKYLRVTDPLTNLYNFRHFMKTLDYEIERAKHFKRPLCLLLMDLDDLKIYNDTFGYKEGDKLLKNIGDILGEVLQEVDIICRYSADEFAVILPEIKIQEAKDIAERIRQAIEKANFKKQVTASLGLVRCIKDTTRHDLIVKANAALRQAKEIGKNRVFCQDL